MKAGSLSLPSTTMHPYMEGLLPTAPPVTCVTSQRADRRRLHSFSRHKYGQKCPCNSSHGFIIQGKTLSSLQCSELKAMRRGRAGEYAEE